MTRDEVVGALAIVWGLGMAALAARNFYLVYRDANLPPSRFRWPRPLTRNDLLFASAAIVAFGLAFAVVGIWSALGGTQ